MYLSPTVLDMPINTHVYKIVYNGVNLPSIIKLLPNKVTIQRRETPITKSLKNESITEPYTFKLDINFWRKKNSNAKDSTSHALHIGITRPQLPKCALWKRPLLRERNTFKLGQKRFYWCNLKLRRSLTRILILPVCILYFALLQSFPQPVGVDDDVQIEAKVWLVTFANSRAISQVLLVAD